MRSVWEHFSPLPFDCQKWGTPFFLLPLSTFKGLVIFSWKARNVNWQPQSITQKGCRTLGRDHELISLTFFSILFSSYMHFLAFRLLASTLFPRAGVGVRVAARKQGARPGWKGLTMDSSEAQGSVSAFLWAPHDAMRQEHPEGNWLE